MRFIEWMKIRETSAFERTRKAAALGLGPKIPAAEINSRNTAPPWQQKKLLGKKRKKGKKKQQPGLHNEIDVWLQSVDSLKKDLEVLKDKVKNKKKEEPKPVEKDEKKPGINKPEDKVKKDDKKSEKPEKQQINSNDDENNNKRRPSSKDTDGDD